MVLGGLADCATHVVGLGWALSVVWACNCGVLVEGIARLALDPSISKREKTALDVNGIN